MPNYNQIVNPEYHFAEKEEKGKLVASGSEDIFLTNVIASSTNEEQFIYRMFVLASSQVLPSEWDL